MAHISIWIPEEIESLLQEEADSQGAIQRKNGKGNKSVVIRQILFNHYKKRGGALSGASLRRVHPGKQRKDE